MKLRKMVTVSAAALMLAGVGASATNAGSSVHASRRTVRISNLRRKSTSLTRQIKSDKYQIKNINRKIARLSRKTAKRSKRSKKTVKRHKRTKKSRIKKSVKKDSKRNKNVQKAASTIERGKVDRKAGIFHLRKGNEVYTFNVNAKGQPITSTEKRLMSFKKYNKKYGKTLTSLKNARMQYILMYQKTHNSNYLMGIQYIYNSMKRIMLFTNI